MAYAKAQVKHGARPEVMLHSALDHATWALRARADALLKPTGTSISVLMPYALAAFNFVRQRRMGKQALAGAVLLGVAGWYMKKRRVRSRKSEAVQAWRLRLPSWTQCRRTRNMVGLERRRNH